MQQEPHILLIDDDPNIRDALHGHLTGLGFLTTTAENAAKGREILASNTVDIIVLDIMMPGEDGLSLCRDISTTQKIPIILLTALADDTDRIVGLEIGADDYVTKPFNPRELVARIRSVLRRTQGSGSEKVITQMAFGSWRYDTAKMELIDQDNCIVALSTGEQKLLKIFLEHPQQTLTRDEIFQHIKGRESLPFERSLDNMISRLRKKIETDVNNPAYIKTVWGGGYQFLKTVTKS